MNLRIPYILGHVHAVGKMIFEDVLSLMHSHVFLNDGNALEEIHPWLILSLYGHHRVVLYKYR
jgi:hypothetical protein